MPGASNPVTVTLSLGSQPFQMAVAEETATYRMPCGEYWPSPPV